MPSRKEISVFGTSFLDLLTCALAALIILFVIVPKAVAEATAAGSAALEEKTAQVQLDERDELDAAAEAADSAGFDSRILLGSFSGFGLMVEWPQRETDVNIGVQRYGRHPEQCGVDHPFTKWGVFLKESRPGYGKNRCALFFMPDIYPDDYTLWVEIDDESVLKRADITATMVYHPGCPDENRYLKGPIPLTGSQRIYIATISIADVGVVKLSHREPLSVTEE